MGVTGSNIAHAHAHAYKLDSGYDEKLNVDTFGADIFIMLMKSAFGDVKRHHAVFTLHLQ